MRKILCDVCRIDITDQDVYGIKVFLIDEKGKDAKTEVRIELCGPCRRDALASVRYWQEHGIVTKYT